MSRPRLRKRKMRITVKNRNPNENPQVIQDLTKIIQTCEEHSTADELEISLEYGDDFQERSDENSFRPSDEILETIVNVEMREFLDYLDQQERDQTSSSAVEVLKKRPSKTAKELSRFLIEFGKKGFWVTVSEAIKKWLQG